MAKTVRIGIDFGTTYSFAGFEHGDFVMPLIPSKETYGIPSVFFYDGKNKLVGRMAESRAIKNPKYAVRSIKRNLSKETFTVADKTFSNKKIVTEIISYIVSCAENQLTNVYLEEYDEIEAVITVPVDFSEPMKQLIREAAAAVKLSNGMKLHITGVIPEPVAAAIEYFGIKKETDANILVYDLGGGTFDAALVQAHADGAVPYEVIDQEGDRKLGGDDWDGVLADWIAGKYEQEFGRKPAPELRELFLREARKFKEELTELPVINEEIPIRGEYLEIELTREEFERMSRPLLDRTVEKIRKLLSRQSGKKIDHVILTGGSTYMPQVLNCLRNEGLFPENMDIRLVEPEHAIAYGAARYAATRIWDGKDVVQKEKIIDLITTHSYGIIYFYSDRGNKEMLEIMIPKGAKLPVSVSMDSYTRFENQSQSIFRVCESDYAGKEKIIQVSEGHQIMSVTIKRTQKVIPKGSRTTETLSISEEGLLTITSRDHTSGIQVNNSVSINRII